MQNIRLDAGAAALLARLHGAGYAAYAVGGCVRDSLLGRTPQDWDLCTSARPEQVLALFGEGQCIPTGLQHGTVTIKYGGQLYETTTFHLPGCLLWRWICDHGIQYRCRSQRIIYLSVYVIPWECQKRRSLRCNRICNWPDCWYAALLQSSRKQETDPIPYPIRDSNAAIRKRYQYHCH